MREFRLRAFRTVLCIGLSSSIMGVALPGTALAVTFPADGAWVVLTRGTDPIVDVNNDSSTDVLDIVGDTEHPMAYVQSNGTHLFFRLRLDKSILQNATNIKPYGWGCVIDSNLDDSNFEYSAILDGVSNPDAVTLWQNLIQEMPNNPGDALGNLPLHSYIGPFELGQPGYGYARQQDAGAAFGSPNIDADYFADWAIERIRLEPGVTDLTPLRFACGSSSDGKNLNSDLSGPANLPDLFSDPPLVCGTLGCFVQNDQTCPEFDTACSVGTGKCATTGIFVCPAGGPAVCNAVEGKPSPEVCNGVDDNCDGDIDENFNIGVPCSAGVGACAATGQIACASDGTAACNVVTGTPGVELCGNAIDDDCDGAVDEDFNVGATCTAGVGACAADGQIACTGDGSAACNAVAGTPSTELCGNTIDDDCDGETDEDFNVGATCTNGVGACATDGQIACTADGGAACNAVAGSPTDEVCGNAVDDDCDGEVDEGFNIGSPCTVGTGACAASGQIQCTTDGSSACNAVALSPTVEVCGDAVDDDCDGVLDNGCKEVPECTTDLDCGAGQICVDRVCIDGCRSDGSVPCPEGQFCSETGSDAGQCVPIPLNDPVIVAGGGCECQTSSSKNTPLGFASAVALAGALALRRRKR